MSDDSNGGGDRPFTRPWESVPRPDVATESRPEHSEDASGDPGDEAGWKPEDEDERPDSESPPGFAPSGASPEEPDAAARPIPGSEGERFFDWDGTTPRPESGAGDPDPDEMGRLAATPSLLDGFTNDDYLAATTREYQGLAEDVARAANEQVETQAVAASIPGVGSGLIGFEDVTGMQGVTEEDVEAHEQARASDLTLRIGTGVVLVGIFAGSLLTGPAAFTAVVLAVMVFSLGELYATVRRRGYSPAAAFGFLGVVGGGIGTYRAGVSAIGTAMALTLVAVGMFYALSPRKRPLENAALTVMGAAWMSLLAFAIGITGAERYVGLVLIVVLVTAAFDIGCYFAGRSFGHRAMAPAISPNKTWEGYFGGVVTAVVLAALLSTFPDIFVLDLRQSLLLAVAVIVLAPLGDAAESMVKRMLGVKDMGSLLPGHGGMLDRMDALLFVVPGAYLLFRGFGLL